MVEAAWRSELEGWALHWFRLAATGDPAAAQSLQELRAGKAAALRQRWTPAELAEDPGVAAMRRLFRAAGCDPTRHRPSSEALIRRVLKGEELAPIHPLVDLNNALSIELMAPACVLAAGTFEYPVTLRAGVAGEVLDSMRGPFGLAGKPLLADARGPFGTPITDSHRVKVRPETDDAWLVVYSATAAPIAVAPALEELLAAAPVARRSD
jgi:DNA/RNA-binding domain of Phe-tRNA-synthetase-like protein